MSLQDAAQAADPSGGPNTDTAISSHGPSSASCCNYGTFGSAALNFDENEFQHLHFGRTPYKNESLKTRVSRGVRRVKNGVTRQKTMKRDKYDSIS